MINTVSDSIAFAEKEIHLLLQADKTQESKNTEKELKNLLIEYVLAKMSGKPTDDLEQKITDTLNEYQKHISADDKLEEDAKAMGSHPDSTTLAKLDEIIAQLKQALGK